MATRRRFSREFKVEAVKLVRVTGISVSQASRDPDLHEGVPRCAGRRATIKELAARKIEVIVLQLGNLDLASTAGKQCYSCWQQ